MYGCRCSVKAVFPNEDRREEKERRAKEEEDQRGYKIDSKQKLRQLIDYQVRKLQADPHLYTQFKEEMDDIIRMRKDRIMRENAQKRHVENVHS